MPDVTDLRHTIVPKSDQLNSEQLLSGPMIIVVTDVAIGSSKEQPVTVHYQGDEGRPFKPCLTMRKVLIHAWGHDGTKWRGKSMELYCDPSVKFGGEIVGGIRISRLSDIPKQINVSLTATKGRKAMHEIRPLMASPELTACLAAITAATNNDGMKKAKALASALTADADVAFALTAYKKKVAQLKEQASATPTTTTSAFDALDSGEIELAAEDVERQIRGAADTNILDLARGQISGVKDEAARLRLTELADQRDAELREST